MKKFHGLDFQALRDGAAAYYSGEQLRVHVIDVLDDFLLDVLVPEPLIETGRGHIVSHVFWTITIDSEDSAVVIVRTDGKIPSGWSAAAAVQARALLPNDGAPPEDDKIVQLAERGVTTLVTLLFVLQADGGVSVLFGRHPDLPAKDAAAMMLNGIEMSIQKRHVIN